MKSIKFIREPGYIFDLFFLHTLYFSDQYCLKYFVNGDKIIADTEYYKGLLNEFGSVSDDLLLFFKLWDNPKSFASTCLFEPYKDDFLNERYDFAKLQSIISDLPSIVEQITRFYFKDIDYETIKACTESLLVLDKLIKKTDYSGDVKSALYSFYINPKAVIQKVSDELREKESWLAQKYKKNGKMLSELQKDFKYDFLRDRLVQMHKQSIDIDSFENVLISFCLCNKNVIKTHYYDNSVVIILGSDYIDFVNYHITRNKMPQLELFGSAISDANRIEILNYIYQHGEVALKEIEQELRGVGTNIYYHLSLMIKAGIIKTRNRGRTVMYSVDEQCFCDVCDIIYKYTGKFSKEKNSEKVENACLG